MEHHEVSGNHRILVVQEAAHVGVKGKLGSLVPGQLFTEILWEINYPVDLPFLHEFLGFRHVDAFGSNFDFSGCIDLTDETAAVWACRFINHCNWGLGKDSVEVDHVVKKWISQSRHEEDKQDSSVGEDVLEFVAEYVPPVAEPCLYVSFVCHDHYSLGKFWWMQAFLSLFRPRSGTKRKQSSQITSFHQPANPAPKMASCT